MRVGCKPLRLKKSQEMNPTQWIVDSHEVDRPCAVAERGAGVGVGGASKLGGGGKMPQETILSQTSIVQQVGGIP